MAFCEKADYCLKIHQCESSPGGAVTRVECPYGLSGLATGQGFCWRLPGNLTLVAEGTTLNVSNLTNLRSYKVIAYSNSPESYPLCEVTVHSAAEKGKPCKLFRSVLMLALLEGQRVFLFLTHTCKQTHLTPSLFFVQVSIDSGGMILPLPVTLFLRLFFFSAPSFLDWPWNQP